MHFSGICKMKGREMQMKSRILCLVNGGERLFAFPGLNCANLRIPCNNLADFP